MRKGTIPFALPPFQGWVRRLVLACAAVFFVQVLLGAYAPKLKEYFEIYASLVPAGVIGHGFIWQLVTYSFVHQTLLHLPRQHADPLDGRFARRNGMGQNSVSWNSIFFLSSAQR